MIPRCARSGRRTVVPRLQLVFHLPHPSSQRRALSRPPLLPARRRGAHPQPGRRAGHEHRLAGRLQPRLEARAGRQRQAMRALLDSYEEERMPVARRLLETTDRAFRLVVSDNWFAGLLRTQVLARVAAFAMGLKRCSGSRFAPSPRSASTIAQARCRNQRRPARSAPRAGDRFPWLQLKLAENGPVEDLFRKFDDLRFHLFVAGQPVPAVTIPEKISAGSRNSRRSRQQRRTRARRNSTACVLPRAPRRLHRSRRYETRGRRGRTLLLRATRAHELVEHHVVPAKAGPIFGRVPIQVGMHCPAETILAIIWPECGSRYFWLPRPSKTCED